MANNAPNNPFEGVAKGLNSPELKSNKTIPFVDECVELDQVKNETTRPKTLDIRKHEMEDEKPQTLKEDKIHAKDLGAVHTSNSDTIVVNTPEGTLYITLDPESKSTPTSPNTQSTDVSESPSTSKAFGAQESNDMIIMEKEVEQRRAGLRRNSISMPTLQNLESEVLKQHYLGNPEDGVSLILLILKCEC
ncbi:hypothetical protein RR46_01916 [Papilio xuthus]|uniref:Uncharacterized protein n=1 Tax=Papilio xuthus TaxID=66420 RepID=A0A194QLX6_PAPXU|nr:hypothetical protein RR46_01916 [Papilio xuthus]